MSTSVDLFSGMPMRRSSAHVLARSLCALAVLSSVGCTGQIGAAGGDGATPGDSPNGTGGANAMGAAVPGGLAAGTPATFLTSPGIRRLTRAEYATTVRALLGEAVDERAAPQELIVEGHSHISGAQKIGYADTESFLELGEQIAEGAAPQVLEQTGCADVACLEAWAPEFLRDAFRRPPPASLIDRYRALLREKTAGVTPVETLRTFLAAVLNSPYFLYKREVGESPGTDGFRTLDPYEIATRLSYLAWQTSPDRTLLDAAEAGNLEAPEERLAQLERLLADPRAADGLRAFVWDWMGLFDNNLSRKTPVLLATTSADFPEVAERGLGLLVNDVLSSSSGRFSELLRTDQVFANQALAEVLGQSGPLSTFERLSIPTQERRGILTHPMVIGAHSKEGGASPFPMGRFLYRNVLCQTIPPPKSIPVVNMEEVPGQTLRQSLEGLTQNEPCFTCHSRIGPPGFAYLPFNAIGRYRPEDALGRPYDTRGELLLADDSKLPFANIGELAEKLADEPQVAACVARRLFRWTFGRFEAPSDAAALAPLEQNAVAENTAVRTILREVVMAKSFTEVRVTP